MLLLANPILLFQVICQEYSGYLCALVFVTDISISETGNRISLKRWLTRLSEVLKLYCIEKYTVHAKCELYFSYRCLCVTKI